jgi:hypothetical protein
MLAIVLCLLDTQPNPLFSYLRIPSKSAGINESYLAAAPVTRIKILSIYQSNCPGVHVVIASVHYTHDRFLSITLTCCMIY